MILYHSNKLVHVENAYLYLFFFFQAEDGIRDVAVTGVQTCALPICTVRTTVNSTKPMAMTPMRSSSPETTGPSINHCVNKGRMRATTCRAAASKSKDRKSVV